VEVGLGDPGDEVGNGGVPVCAGEGPHDGERGNDDHGPAEHAVRTDMSGERVSDDLAEHTADGVHGGKDTDFGV